MKEKTRIFVPTEKQNDSSPFEKYRTEILCAIFTFGFGLAAHAFMFFNPCFSEDALIVAQNIPQRSDDAWQLSLGRFMQPLYRLLRGEITAAWLIGLLSLLFLSAALVVIVKTLNIRSTWGIALSCGILATNASLSLTYASFSPWGDVYMLALLCAVSAVWLCRRKWYGILAGALLVCIAMGLYQAYVCAAVGLATLCAIADCIENKAPLDILKGLARCAGMVLLGGILYFILMRLSLAVTGMGLSNGYNGIAEVGRFAGYSLGAVIAFCYQTFVQEIIEVVAISKWTTAACGLVIAGLCVFWALRLRRSRKINGKTMALLLLLVLLLPAALNIVVFLSKDLSHSLMRYSCYLVYLLPILIYEQYRADFPAEGKNKDRSFVWVLAAAVGLVIWNNVIFANGIYTEKYVQERATLSVMTRVMDRVEQTQGYIPKETTILFVGNLNDSAMALKLYGFEQYSALAVSPDQYSITYPNAYYDYLRFFMGCSPNKASNTTIKRISALPEVEAMPNFPAEGCCAMVEGFLVVKLS